MIDWLLDPTNSKTISALATVFAATIASITAVVLAFVSYPRQKRLDREAKLKTDCDNAFVRFFEKIELMVNFSIIDEHDARLDRIFEAKSALNALGLHIKSIPFEPFGILFGTAMECGQFMQKINASGEGANKKDIDVLRTEFGEQFNDCINLARKELNSKQMLDVHVGGMFLELRGNQQ